MGLSERMENTVTDSAPASTGGEKWVLHYDAMARCWRVVGKGPDGEPGERVSVVPEADAERWRGSFDGMVEVEKRLEAKLGAAREALERVVYAWDNELRTDLYDAMQTARSELGGE